MTNKQTDTQTGRQKTKRQTNMQKINWQINKNGQTDGIYLFKVKNGSTRKICDTHSK